MLEIWEGDIRVSNDIIFGVRSLKQWFPVSGFLGRHSNSYVKAVDDITLQVHRGETLGIVGESGCGKSTLIRTMMKLIKPSDGKIYFEGQDVTAAGGKVLREFWRNVQIIFQDPYASLNPRQKVRNMLGEAIDLGNMQLSGEQKEKEILQLLQLVGLPPDAADKFPHEFSGGQRQRLCIARALAVKPKIIMCDECVSALDVSIQAQIINLLMRLKKEMDLTLIFVSHDLRVIRNISDAVAVMYLGKIIEYADTDDLFTHPMHPYTKSLLSAVPSINLDETGKTIILKGDIPSPIHVPQGCPFHTRCWMAREECGHISCPIYHPGTQHFSACPFADSLADKK